jgi:hypothetical protein
VQVRFFRQTFNTGARDGLLCVGAQPPSPRGCTLFLSSARRGTILARVLSSKFIEKQKKILRLTTPKLRSAWGPVRSG